MSMLQNMPSTASMFSMYTTFMASTMLVRTMVNEVQNLTGQLMSQRLRNVLQSRVNHLFGSLWSQMTVIVDEYRGMSINEIYGASEAYLSTRISPSTWQVNISRVSHEQNISVTVAVNERAKIIDAYEGITIMWEFISTPTQAFTYEAGYPSMNNSVKRSIRLSFHKKYKDVVLGVYLPHVMERSKAMKGECKVVKLYSYNFHSSYSGSSGPWASINLDHPSTFDTLAMDPGLKKDLIDDLDRFLKRKDYYKRVGKAWKRGYLLYGPPGTGKSSLIAAMANYLKFDIYDLTKIYRIGDFRGILTSAGNYSILVIEDIDCSIELQSRNYGDSNGSDSQLKLSGLLNFIDGLWSSCGDGRIIVFTTNYKDKLDPALLRPGRMDMHIHMSYCDPCGFRILASNYLSLKSHHLFPEIEDLLVEVEVTPAEVAGEMMKSEDADIALAGLTGLLLRRKVQKQEEGLENKAVKEEVVSEVEAKAGKKRATECGQGMGRRRKRVAVG